MSRCSDVRQQDEMLVTVSFAVKGSMARNSERACAIDAET